LNYLPPIFSALGPARLVGSLFASVKVVLYFVRTGMVLLWKRTVRKDDSIMKKNLLPLLIALWMVIGLGASASAAATIRVRQDGTGEATTIAAAIALATTSDTIDIQQFSTDFDETGNFSVTGVRFVSTATTQPVIRCSTNSYIFIEATNCSFENLHFKGKSGWQVGVRARGSFSVKHCLFTDFTVANPLSLICQSNAPVLQGTVEYTYIYGPNQMVSFEYWYDDGLGVPAPTTANLGPILFNHCTLVNNDNFQVWFQSGFPGDLSNITFRNCIFSAVSGGTFFNSAAINPNRSSNCNIVHEYNCYSLMWDLFYGCSGSVISATEKCGTVSAPINPFKDITTGDFTLSPSDTFCLRAGSDGKNIGADVTTVAPPKTISVKQDGTGDATTIAGAIALAASGDTIDIQQFTADFDEVGGFSVAGVAFKSSTTAKPVIKASAASYIFAEATNCTFENIHFKGKAGWQQGLRLRGSFNVNNCVFSDFGDGNPLSLACQSNTGVLQGTVEYSYIFGPNQMVAFEYWYDDGLGIPAPTAANLGPILFNHCTLINNDNFQVKFQSGFPGDLSNVTFRNCIFGAVQSGALFNSAAFQPYRSSNCNLVHEYNCYVKMWDLFYGVSGSAAGATEKVGTSAAPINPFKDVANGDFTLSTYDTYCLGAGSDGKNIGADVDTTATLGPRTIIVRQDGAGDATTIAGALAIASSGDTIEIQQFTSAFDETGEFSVDGVTFVASTATRPVIKSTAASYIFREADNCSFENLHFQGKATWQTGLRMRGSFHVNNCLFSDFTLGNPLALDCQSNTAKLQGTVEYSYIYGPSDTISFQLWYDTGTGVPAPTTANLGPIVFNHNTIINNDNFQFNFDAAFPGDLSNISFTNNIIGAVRSGAIYNSAAFHVNRTSNSNLVHEYNCYLQTWSLIYGVDGSTTNASELVDANGGPLDPFHNLAAADYSLDANSICVGTASDGKDIGAYQYVRPNAAKGSWIFFN
jgi:hypothetical protein